MKYKLILVALWLFALYGPAFAQNVGGDPCQSPQGPKANAVIAVSSATTTLVAGGIAGSAVDVCGYSLTAGGTTPTFKFEYGTQATNPCDTGATALTGTYAPTAGTLAVAEGGLTMFAAPQGKQLCIVTTGSGSPSFQGQVTYALGN